MLRRRECHQRKSLLIIVYFLPGTMRAAPWICEINAPANDFKVKFVESAAYPFQSLTGKTIIDSHYLDGARVRRDQAFGRMPSVCTRR